MAFSAILSLKHAARSKNTPQVMQWFAWATAGRPYSEHRALSIVIIKAAIRPRRIQ